MPTISFNPSHRVTRLHGVKPEPVGLPERVEARYQIDSVVDLVDRLRRELWQRLPTSPAGVIDAFLNHFTFFSAIARKRPVSPQDVPNWRLEGV